MATVLLTLLLGLPAITIGPLLPQRTCFDRLFAWWSAGILAATGSRLEVLDRSGHSWAQPCFFVGNHQSALDIPAIALAAQGHLRFMAKKSLFRIPIIGWCMHLYGCVPIDRSSARRTLGTMKNMLERLKKNPQSILIFAEGTRSTSTEIQPFKHGSFNVCRQAGLPIVPFAIAGSQRVHRRGVFRVNPGTIRVSLGPVIRPQDLAGDSTADLARQVHHEVVRLHEELNPAPTRAVMPAHPADGDPA